MHVVAVEEFVLLKYFCDVIHLQLYNDASTPAGTTIAGDVVTRLINRFMATIVEWSSVQTSKVFVAMPRERHFIAIHLLVDSLKVRSRLRNSSVLSNCHCLKSGGYKMRKKPLE